ncbi:hypothetical protein BHM03_00059130 [Ensete ventricosum]|nr:hypothetical protein BHM03_00059130 [Ensete ventricosum]
MASLSTVAAYLFCDPISLRDPPIFHQSRVRWVLSDGNTWKVSVFMPVVTHRIFRAFCALPYCPSFTSNVPTLIRPSVYHYSHGPTWHSSVTPLPSHPNRTQLRLIISDPYEEVGPKALSFDMEFKSWSMVLSK